MSANTCEFVVGRLLEIRVSAGYKSPDDVTSMIATMSASFARMPASEHFVIAADWRAVLVMSPATAARVQQMLAGFNPRVTRSAILTQPENAVGNLQVLRIVREAENEKRRAFTDPRKMHTWLTELLSTEESTRLQSFLAASPPH